MKVKMGMVSGKKRRLSRGKRGMTNMVVAMLKVLIKLCSEYKCN